MRMWTCMSNCNEKKYMCWWSACHRTEIDLISQCLAAKKTKITLSEIKLSDKPYEEMQQTFIKILSAFIWKVTSNGFLCVCLQNEIFENLPVLGCETPSFFY